MGEGEWLRKWDAVVAGGSAAEIEEFWLARLEGGVADAEPFVEALRRLRSAGKKTLAVTLLELAADQALGEQSWAARKVLLAEMLRLGVGDAARLREELERCVRHVWADKPSLDAHLRHFALGTSRKPVEVLEQVELWLTHDLGDVFFMAGRGPGRVVEASPALGVLRLDFERERRVPVPIEAAPKYLTPLARGHFLRRRLEEKSALAREVAEDPEGSLAAILVSLGRPVAASEIRATLEGLLQAEQWSGWWNRAKKNPRVLAEGTGTKVEYRLAAAEGAEDEIRAQFATSGLTQQVEAARRHGGRSRALADEMAAALLSGAEETGEDAAVAWEALAVASRLGAPAERVEASRRRLLERVGADALLVAVGDASQREEVLEAVRESDTAWPDVFAAQLERETHSRLLLRLAGELLAGGQSARVATFLDQVFLHPVRFPHAFVWACERGENNPLESVLDARRTGALLVRLPELAERREFGSLRGRLKEVLSARGIAGRIVQERLTLEQARRLLQLVERPGELAEERRWLSRAVAGRFPELRQTKADDSVPALAATVTRLQAELRRLLEKEIPETLKAIQVAREHGDLTENFEYHAARARQEYLSARAAELQDDLARVRVIDPAKVDTSKVRVGTTVRLVPVSGGGERELTILGPYEANPELGVLSHAAEVAQALLGHKVGEQVVLDGGSWRIAAIERATVPASS